MVLFRYFLIPGEHVIVPTWNHFLLLSTLLPGGESALHALPKDTNICIVGASAGLAEGSDMPHPRTARVKVRVDVRLAECLAPIGGLLVCFFDDLGRPLRMTDLPWIGRIGLSSSAKNNVRSRHSSPSITAARLSGCIFLL